MSQVFAAELCYIRLPRYSSARPKRPRLWKEDFMVIVTLCSAYQEVTLDVDHEERPPVARHGPDHHGHHLSGFKLTSLNPVVEARQR